MPTAIRSGVPSGKNSNHNRPSVVPRAHGEDRAAEEGAELLRIRKAAAVTLQHVGQRSRTNIAMLSMAERGIIRLAPGRRAVVLQVLRDEIKKHAVEVNAILAQQAGRATASA